jgi:hypothetical protein
MAAKKGKKSKRGVKDLSAKRLSGKRAQSVKGGLGNFPTKVITKH